MNSMSSSKKGLLYSRLIDKNLRRVYQEVIRKTEGYLSALSLQAVGYFTEHGAPHSRAVISVMDRLVTRGDPANSTLLKDFNSMEIFILLCSAWLHDIGMLVTQDPEGRRLRSKEIRQRHHELSADIIRMHHRELGIDNEHVARFVADVCYFHSRRVKIEDLIGLWSESMDLQSVLREPTAVDGNKIRILLLAALLRVADALETDSRRALHRIFRDVTYLPKISEVHWRASELIYGAIYDGPRIVLCAHHKTEEEAKILHWKLKDLCHELNSVKDIFKYYDFPYRLEAQVESETDGRRRLEKYSQDHIIAQHVKTPELIAYEGQAKEFCRNGQHVFAADCWREAAEFYERSIRPDAVSSVLHIVSSDEAMTEAIECYKKARDQIETARHKLPQERFFLETLHKYYYLRVQQLNGELRNNDSANLFLEHIHKIQQALDSLEGYLSLGKGGPPSILRLLIRAGRAPNRELAQSSVHQRYDEIEISTDGSVHDGCCECTAHVISSLLLSGKGSEKEDRTLRKAGKWLTSPDRKKEQWRSKRYHSEARPMSYMYAAATLDAFVEFEHSQLSELANSQADEVAKLLVQEQDQWLDDTEGMYLETIARILYSLGRYMRRRGLNFGATDFTPLLAANGRVRKFITEFSGYVDCEKGQGLRGLLLWRELEGVDQSRQQGLNPDALKQIACATAQVVFEHPVWAEDGSWGYNLEATRRFVESWLSFWEYFLLGEDADLQEFARLGKT